MSEVVVFGAGRGADVAFRYLSSDDVHDVVAFTVDREYLEVDSFNGLPVVPFEEVEDAYPPAGYDMFALLGYEDMNGLRRDKYLAGKAKGYDFVSYVSSDIHAPEEIRVGENCFIMEGQTINLDVEIGNNVVMWSGNHVGDNTVVEDHVWFSSHVCIGGDSRIGERCFLGNNCTIPNAVHVASECYIGAGALVGANTEQGGVYVISPTERAAMDSRRFMQLVSLHSHHKFIE